MALRNIVTYEDPILRKKCRPVPEVTDRIKQLVDDMIETLYDAQGVGLAAPQVGVLRRIFVVDIMDGTGPKVLINPEIVETRGEQDGEEGCLSVPDRAGEVIRPEYVKVKGLDRDGQPVEYEGEGLLARAFCHENDHLDGVLYVDKAKQLWEIQE
ncbi:MAG: peptide deformylase [Anaerovoracaceae bacterium]|nr:peptide deformylase [Bacillota bacterium]MDY2670092.1 peptide deformylase [Anaerovoracaceae bacterium]